MSETLISSIPTEALQISKQELAARLRTPIGYRDGPTDALEAELRKTVQAAAVTARFPILKNEGNCIELSCFSIQSEALAKHLQGCEAVYLMAVTLGMQTERWLHRLSILSPAKHFIADAIASAYAEAAADCIHAALAKDQALTNRFSPGYADLPLSVQPQLLSAINANKYLHILLNDSLLMIPQKSITAIVGIRSEMGKE